MLNANPIVTEIASNPSLLARLDAASTAVELQYALLDAGITLSGRVKNPTQSRSRSVRSSLSRKGLDDSKLLASVAMILCPSE
jgi:hypothetical protein